MATGIEINDVNGKMQFNGEMLTYALRVSGVCYVENRRVGNTSATSLLIPTSQSYPNGLVALGGGDGLTAAYAGVYAPTNQRIYATGGAPVGSAFNYYIFERSNTIPATGFGLEVRNGNNEVTFSSNTRTMRVINMLGSPRGSTPNVSYGGRTLAYCQGAFSGHRQMGQVQIYNQRGQLVASDEGGGSYTYYYQNDGKVYGGVTTNGGQTVSAQQVTWDDVRIGPSSSYPSAPNWYKELNLFVVDVTGFPIGRTFY